MNATVVSIVRRGIVCLSCSALAVSGAGCTEEARNDVAKRTFIAAVNLKCKVSKSEAKLAWNLADDLGAGVDPTAAMSSARAATDKLLAEIDRLDGPADIVSDVTASLRRSRDVVREVAAGSLTIEQGREQLDTLRQNAKDQGLGECVTM